MNETTDSLLREVDEALRADRALSLWQQHRKTIIGMALALVLGTAASNVWQHYREARGGDTLYALSQAEKLLATGKAEEAAAGFKAVADQAGSELKPLAMIWQARALVLAGKPEEAAAALKEAASGKGLWADIACLRLAGLNAKEATCLSNAQTSPLASTRAEWAAAEAWAKGDATTAIAALEKIIADPATPPETSARLTQWLAIMKAGKEGK